MQAMRKKLILLTTIFPGMLWLPVSLQAASQTDLSLEGAIHSIETAHDAGAEIYAPLELDFAEQRLEQAQLALQVNDKAAFQRIRDEVIVTAEFAETKSRLAKMREQVEAISQENARLHKELLGENSKKEDHDGDYL